MIFVLLEPRAQRIIAAMLLAVLAVAAFLGLWWFTRSQQLFAASMRDGRVLLVRGRAPGGFLRDLGEIAQRNRKLRGTITGHRTERAGRLTFSGNLDEGAKQRMRNSFALYPAAQLLSAPKIARPSLGQLLGVAWLAWLFDSLRR